MAIFPFNGGTEQGRCEDASDKKCDDFHSVVLLANSAKIYKIHICLS